MSGDASCGSTARTRSNRIAPRSATNSAPPGANPNRKYRLSSFGNDDRQNRRSVVPTNFATFGSSLFTAHFTRWNGARHIRSRNLTCGSRSIRGISNHVKYGAPSITDEAYPHHAPDERYVRVGLRRNALTRLFAGSGFPFVGGASFMRSL